MADVELDIAFWNYDRTRALSDGNVRIKGVDAKYHGGSNVIEIFRGHGCRAPIRCFGTGPHLLSTDLQSRRIALCSNSGFSGPRIPAFGDLCEYKQWHKQARGPERQNYRRTRALQPRCWHRAKRHPDGGVRVQTGDLPLAHRRPRLAAEADRLRFPYAPRKCTGGRYSEWQGSGRHARCGRD